MIQECEQSLFLGEAGERGWGGRGGGGGGRGMKSCHEFSLCCMWGMGEILCLRACNELPPWNS